MSTNEINMQSFLPQEILDLEEDYNEISRLGCNGRYNLLNNMVMMAYEKEKEHTIEKPVVINMFQFIFKSTISELKEKNLSDKDVITVFIRKLIEPINWESFYCKNKELAQKFTLKLANAMVEHGGYRTICGWPHENPCYSFWWTYKNLNSGKKYIEFLKKINAEVNEIIKSKDEDTKKQLLPKINLILNFFYLMTAEENKETRKELDKITVNSLKLLSEYEYKLEKIPGSGTCAPLTYIFGELNSKKTKNLIMKYLIEYANYFYELRMDNRECVIDVVYPEEEKSEVFRIYLENALMLKRSDLYSGDILDKVFTKLFRKFEAERYGDIFLFGEDSPEDFCKTLVVINEICDINDNWKLLLDTDFFDKLNKMYSWFIYKYFESENKTSRSDLERKMILCYSSLQLHIALKKEQLGLEVEQSKKVFTPKGKIKIKR